MTVIRCERFRIFIRRSICCKRTRDVRSSLLLFWIKNYLPVTIKNKQTTTLFIIFLSNQAKSMSSLAASCLSSFLYGSCTTENAVPRLSILVCCPKPCHAAQQRASGKLRKRLYVRANECRLLVCKLGPTFAVSPNIKSNLGKRNNMTKHSARHTPHPMSAGRA